MRYKIKSGKLSKGICKYGLRFVCKTVEILAVKDSKVREIVKSMPDNFCVLLSILPDKNVVVGVRKSGTKLCVVRGEKGEGQSEGKDKNAILSDKIKINAVPPLSDDEAKGNNKTAEATLNIYFKNLKSATPIVLGKQSIKQAFAQGRFVASGDYTLAMPFVEILNIATAYIFPKCVCDKILQGEQKGSAKLVRATAFFGKK